MEQKATEMISEMEQLLKNADKGKNHKRRHTNSNYRKAGM